MQYLAPGGVPRPPVTEIGIAHTRLTDMIHAIRSGLKMSNLVSVIAALLAASDISALQVSEISAKMNSDIPCEKLQWDWQHVEKRMAFDAAVERNGYNVPPMIELILQEGNDYSRASLILQLMRDNKCPMPTRAPRSTTYFTSSNACIKARKSGRADAPSLCDEEKWIAGQ